MVAGYAHDSQQTIWAQRWEGFRQHGCNRLSTVVVKLLSRVQLFASPWTVVSQASILEWVAMPSSRGSSRCRDQTQVCGLAGRSFTTEPPGKPQLALVLF